MTIITKDTQEGYEVFGSLKAVTEEKVYAFSGGFPKGPGWPNKNIHTDLECARNSGLTTRIASATMSEGYIVELMIDLFGESWLTEGRMSLKFIAIIAVGDTVLPKAIIRSKQAENSGVRFVMEVWCENQHGNKVVIGTATSLVQ